MRWHSQRDCHDPSKRWWWLGLGHSDNHGEGVPELQGFFEDFFGGSKKWFAIVVTPRYFFGETLQMLLGRYFVNFATGKLDVLAAPVSSCSPERNCSHQNPTSKVSTGETAGHRFASQTLQASDSQSEISWSFHPKLCPPTVFSRWYWCFEIWLFCSEDSCRTHGIHRCDRRDSLSPLDHFDFHFHALQWGYLVAAVATLD